MLTQGNHKIVINSRSLGLQLDTPYSHNIINNVDTNIGANNDTGMDVSLIVAHSVTVAGV